MHRLEKAPLHLFIRFRARSFKKKGSMIKTLQEHQKLLLTKGEVWWGIARRKAKSERISAIKNQILNGIRTRVYMYENETEKWYLGHLIDITSCPPPDKGKIPTYYREDSCATYLKFSEIIDLFLRQRALRGQNPIAYVYEDGGVGPKYVKVASSGQAILSR